MRGTKCKHIMIVPQALVWEGVEICKTREEEKNEGWRGRW